jgi:TonB-dependent SusC/RagA subfamily outer membrane receptor
MKIKIIFLLLLPVLFITNSPGQKSNKKFVISGIVTDAQNRPVVGALIMVDKNNTNIVTNQNGFYRVRVRPGDNTITIVTFNNGISDEAINGRTTIDFTLGKSGVARDNTQDNSKKDEVVNIGYGTVKQKNLLTNVNTIDATNNKYASYKNIYEILKGTPGVMVTGNSIKIQGQSSFNSGTEPLFVVNGMTVESIDGISPAMVESISVLKGAATSIYGSRGTNGVIIITLLNGSEKNK